MTAEQRIFIIGGYYSNNKSYLDTCYEIDINYNITIKKRNMINRRRKFAAALHLNKFIYVIGGYSGSYPYLNKCERYNISDDCWESVADYPFDITGSFCVIFNN